MLGDGDELGGQRLGTRPQERWRWEEAGLGGAAQSRQELPSSLLQVLDTYMFHSFLKARLSRRMDAFAQMDLSTQSEEDRCLCCHVWALSS